MRLQDKSITDNVRSAVMRGIGADGSGCAAYESAIDEIMDGYEEGIRGFEVPEGTSEREERERCMNRMILALHCALSDWNVPALWRYKIVSDAMDRLTACSAFQKCDVRGWVE